MGLLDATKWQEKCSVGIHILGTVEAGTGSWKHSLSWGVSVETGSHHKQIALLTVRAKSLT